MQIRRGLQYLERPIPTHINAGKLYYGYSAYDPRRVAQYLEIFRAYTYYIKADAKGGYAGDAVRFGARPHEVRGHPLLLAVEMMACLDPGNPLRSSYPTGVNILAGPGRRRLRLSPFVPHSLPPPEGVTSVAQRGASPFAL